MRLLWSLRSPFIDCNWLTACGQVGLGLAEVGLDAAYVGLDVGQVAGNGGDLLRRHLLGVFQAPVLSRFAGNDLLGPGVHLLLGQPQRLAQFFGRHLQPGVGFAQFGGQFRVLLVGLGQRRLPSGQSGRSACRSRSDRRGRTAARRQWRPASRRNMSVGLLRLNSSCDLFLLAGACPAALPHPAGLRRSRPNRSLQFPSYPVRRRRKESSSRNAPGRP